jgi:flagellar assembly factor FliW
MTANLKAPLIFNLANRKGKQLVLNNAAYTTRHNLLEEVRKQSETQQTSSVQTVIEKAKATREQEVQENLGQASSNKK